MKKVMKQRVMKVNHKMFSGTYNKKMPSGGVLGCKKMNSLGSRN